jgi:molybdopterin molybdotransferase
MIPVAEARARMIAAAKPLPAEWAFLGEAAGRALAAAIIAIPTQPPKDVSAMDGYAVRGADVAAAPKQLKVIGTAAAGHRFAGPAIGPGEAVRIFTGAPMPEGADTVVVQENVQDLGASAVVLREAAVPGQNVRAQGSDFASGQTLLSPGKRLDAPALALAASGGHTALAVRRRPRVAVIATGDELVRPGQALQADQIISSNGVGLATLIAAAGGVPADLGIAADTPEAIAAAVRAAKGADVLVTIGGASVGAHDLVHPTLEAEGVTFDFWKIAMRPGKPLMFGTGADGMLFLGLPGNPVSALVCGLLFLRPLLLALQGLPTALPELTLPLAAPLPANKQREDYLRAEFDGTGVRAFPQQSSAMLTLLARADGLIRRPPGAPPAPAGSPVPVLPLAGLW